MSNEGHYRAPWYARNRHLNTIISSVAPHKIPDYTREQYETSDGDFFHVDWLKQPSPTAPRKCVIICHGLEGSSRSPYVASVGQALFAEGWDIAAVNYRGCSGVPNRFLRSYHSGFTDDLRQLVTSIDSAKVYSNISLVGFSIGGNITLKFLGETPDAPIQKAVAISTPIHLESCALLLGKPKNFVYMQYFLHSFRGKILEKKRLFGEKLNVHGLYRIMTFKQYDSRFTAPLSGYESAEEYWTANSSERFLDRIKVPTLFLTAADDPFLDERCFPVEAARLNSKISLEITAQGGHVGFLQSDTKYKYYSDQRCAEYLR